MRQTEGRYSVCDEARRAPNNLEIRSGSGTHQYWGEDGECQRFDDFKEAKQFAERLWATQGRHHLIVIKDKAEGDKIVQAFEVEPHDTKPGG